MGTEIERRFRIDSEAYLDAGLGEVKLLRKVMIWQGYVSTDPVVRVRITDSNDAWLTIKGQGGIQRSEWEYPIPLRDAQELFDLACRRNRILTKRRYKVEFEGHVWDVDKFTGPLQGLWIAEIELRSPDELFARPPWLRDEVTEDPRYSNVSLAEHGLPQPV